MMHFNHPYRQFNSHEGSKRLLSYDIQSIQDEPGLEGPENLRPQDSQGSIMSKIGSVYTTTNAQDFADAFSFLGEEDDAIKAALETVRSSNDIPDGTKEAVMMALIQRMATLSTERTFQKLDDLQGETLGPGDDVTEKAKAVLQGITGEAKLHADGSNKDDNESTYYKDLADNIDGMGLKKSELLRTADLTERVKLLEKKLNRTQGRLNRLQSFSSHVEHFASQAADRTSFWSKAWMGIKDAVPLLTTSGIGWTAGAAFGSLLTGGVGLAAGAGVGVLINKWRKPGIRNNSRYAVGGEDYKSLLLQQQLLEKGKVKVDAGQVLKEFRVPQPLKMFTGATIDGKTITQPTVAPRNAVVSGPTAEGKELTLPRGTEKELTEKAAEQQQELAELQHLLNDHNQNIGSLKAEFDADYQELSEKVTLAVQSSEAAAKLYAIAKARYDRNNTPANQNEMNLAKKTLDEANAVMDRAKKALEQLDRLKRVYKLNDDFARTPEPKAVIEALYQQTVNPEAFDLMIADHEAQDKALKQAQSLLGRTKTDKLDELVAGLEDEARDKLNEFLEDLDDLRGRPMDSVESKHPILRQLKSKNRQLYSFCEALTKVPPATRYATNPEGREPDKILKEVIKTVKDRPEPTPEDQEEGDNNQENGDSDLQLQTNAAILKALERIEEALKNGDTKKKSKKKT